MYRTTFESPHYQSSDVMDVRLSAFSLKVHLLIQIKATLQFCQWKSASTSSLCLSDLVRCHFFPWQLQSSISLLSCAMPWWPCRPYPASPVWMTADKSPGLLLASAPLCNSTAGECAFSYEAHCHKSTKDTGTNPRQIALKLQRHFSWQFIDRDNCHYSNQVLLHQ